jgi:hypothetical protein
MNKLRVVNFKKCVLVEDQEGDCFIIVQEKDGMWRGMSSLVGPGLHFATREAATQAAVSRYNQVKGTGDDSPIARPEPVGFKLN